MYFYAITCIFQYSTKNIQKLVDHFTSIGVCFCETKILVFGNKTIFSCVVKGSWQSCSKLESLLNKQAKNGYEFVMQKTNSQNEYTDTVPFVLEGTALSSKILLSNLFDFFAAKKIIVHKLSLDTIVAPRSNAEMMSCVLNLHIPIKYNIANIKEEIYELMETLNIDGILQHERGIN